MRLRPVSPVKALSNFFGSSTKLSQYLIPPPAAGDGPSSPSPTGRQPNVATKESADDGARGRFTVVDSADTPLSGSMFQLETTFNTYIVALHCRAGNIVGRALRQREGADELAVNELYNTLVEYPNQHQAAAEVPVDILFSAFEKFIANEWKDRMGEIISFELLQTMQLTFDRSPHSELSRRIKAILNELSPQNRRVLAAIVKLLYDLLEESGNDADRGALTASFAEILFLEGDPHQYITLLDRLVDDVDTFFDGKSMNLIIASVTNFPRHRSGWRTCFRTFAGSAELTSADAFGQHRIHQLNRIIIEEAFRLWYAQP